MEEKAYYPLNSVRICIDSMEPNATGTAYTPLLKTPIDFTDIGYLIVKLDELFDEKGYPQSYQDKRSFTAVKESENRYHGLPTAGMEASLILSKAGRLTTYDVMIDTRRNSSWQGTCYDASHTSLGTFEGDMELMKILMKS